MLDLSSQLVDHSALHDLVLRCADRDETAFAEYYRLTSPSLNAVVSQRVRCQAEVETVLVKIYVAIWRRSDRYAETCSTNDASSVWRWTMEILEQTLAPCRSRNGRCYC